MQTREEAEIARKSIALVGTVSGRFSIDENMPVVVAAYSTVDGGRKIAHFVMLHEPGPYELMVPEGEHNIVAFGDKNKNLTYEEGEPAAQILGAEEVSPVVGGVSGELNLVLADQEGKPIDLPLGFHIQPKGHNTFHSTCPGAIADLDNILFSDEYGKKGFWTPLEFFDEVGGNVYFLEKYDPEKIPILFVHGASGSPQNWLAFFEGIDRDIYQPWIYYYPSGSTIDSMSYLLYWKMQNLQAKYRFKNLCIVAHSMGGLVSRSFLVNFGRLFPSINCFITLSTPWGGEPFAETGVKYSPAVVPAWRDMQPGSHFIESIYAKKIPPFVDHYLMFGHRGNRNILRPNNDKVVTLSSQLDQRAQKDATMIYGYDEDHVSILSGQQVLTQFNAILADKYEATEGEERAGNRLQVNFSFNYPENEPRPMPGLLIWPVDKREDGTWLYIRPEDSGRIYGPFPPGDYGVSMLAHGFFPEPVQRFVHIAPGAMSKLDFTFNPAGILRGYVRKYSREEIFMGQSPQPDPDLEIKTVTLRGVGIERTLVPLMERGNFAEHYLLRKDYSSEGMFFFFDLPKGEYELIIHAAGHKPYHGKCKVMPGQYQKVLAVELQKKDAEDF